MAAIEDKCFGKVFEGLPKLTGKCYAITGCTSGTGLWAAIAAARKGASCVILLNRTSERADAAEKQVKTECVGNSRVLSIDCELQSFASVRKAASLIRNVAAEFGGLDGLINNAGVMAVPDTRTADGHDVQMQTNHLSHFLLTNLLMPCLEAAAATRGEARVVQHSSSARGKKGDLEAQFFWVSEPGALGGDAIPACFSRYHQTKLSNSVFAMALHDKLSATGSKVKSLCAEPGVSATSLMSNMTAGHAAASLEKIKLPSSPTPPGGGPAFTVQSAADGACPLIEASFGASANSGDFFMPDTIINGGPNGMPTKCMTGGRPTPIAGPMTKMFDNEALTMNNANRVLLWEASEKVTEQFVVKNASKL